MPRRAQIPLIAISQIPWVKRNPTVGNMSFWVGLFIGFPMLNIGCVVSTTTPASVRHRLTSRTPASYILF